MNISPVVRALSSLSFPLSLFSFSSYLPTLLVPVPLSSLALACSFCLLILSIFLSLSLLSRFVLSPSFSLSSFSHSHTYTFSFSTLFIFVFHSPLYLHLSLSLLATSFILPSGPSPYPTRPVPTLLPSSFPDPRSFLDPVVQTPFSLAPPRYILRFFSPALAVPRSLSCFFR